VEGEEVTMTPPIPLAGHYQEKDKVWQDALGDYLIKECMSDNFYWSATHHHHHHHHH
jgi:hypothetical protein